MKAVFLDRDGIINERKQNNYVKSVNEFIFLPKVKEAIKNLSQIEHKIIIITNQRGIGLGLFSITDLEEINIYMTNEIKKGGGRIDGVYVCPHLENQCYCRKPKPYMLDQAKYDFSIDLEKSWVIGDSLTDILMGKSRNCKTIYISDKQNNEADFTVSNLYDAVTIIKNNIY